MSLIHDSDPDEGCELLVLEVTNVSSANGSVVVVGGIHDVSAAAVVAIEEVDFNGAVLETKLPVGVLDGAGGLSPIAAEVKQFT